jgi:hypothetical protein
MARQAPAVDEQHNLMVMANTYLVCASAIDEVLGEDSEPQAPRAMAQHA